MAPTDTFKSFIAKISWLQVALLCSLFISSFAYNLDPRIPIIKQMAKETYFGYSVAQHQILNPGRSPENVILVGAPHDSTNQIGTNRTGAIYRCEFNYRKNDCTQLNIENDFTKPPENVLKDDQWLGVTVKSQGAGGYAMACAHRYVDKGANYRWGLGICYSLHQNLTRYMKWNPCESKSKSRAHEQYGFCQAGTSGTLTGKDTNEIVIGTPGPYTWRGTIFKNSVSFNLKDDRSWYMGPVTNDKSPVEKYSYLGMSVTTGKFFQDIPMSYVAGAPRANGTGQVVFFSKNIETAGFIYDLIISGDKFASSFGYALTSLDFNSDGYLDLFVGAPFHYDNSKKTSGAVYIYMNSLQGLKADTKPFILYGRTVESRFGFAVENAGDLNQDGYPDLAVGAPYDSDGAVYIYSGSAEGPKSTPSQIIKAIDLHSIALPTFGYSLSGGIDMDGNGYPDLVIGAYQADAVAVLRTRPVVNVTTVIEGSYTNLNPNQEDCPYEDEVRKKKRACFMIRPCFTLESPVLMQTKGSSVTLESTIEAETFTDKKYSRVFFNSSENSNYPNVMYRELIVDTRSREKQCYKEVIYIKDKSDILNPIKFKLTYRLQQKVPKPPKESDRLHDIDDYPILDQAEASKIFEAKYVKDCGDDEICTSDLQIKSSLRLEVITDNIYLLVLGNGAFNLDVAVENRRESAYDTKLYVSHPVNVKMIDYDADEQGIQCLSNGTEVVCDLGNPMPGSSSVMVSLAFDPIGVSDIENILPFKVSINTSSVNPPVKPQVMEAKLVRIAELKLSGKSEPSEVYYGGIPKGTSAMKLEDEIGPIVTHMYEVTNKGPLGINEFTVHIDWPFEVASEREHGKYALYLMKTPIVVGNGYCVVDKEYLNPGNVPLKNLSSSQLPFATTTEASSRNDGINNENLDVKSKNSAKNEQSLGYNNKDESNAPKKRRKRELVVLPKDVDCNGKKCQVVYMNCKDKTAKCFSFHCKLFNLPPTGMSFFIKIRSRLWNSTFTEDYPDISWVDIESNARLQIDEKFDITQDTADDTYSISTKVTPDSLKIPGRQKKSVPVWIIIVSVLAGLVLLAIVILLLIKFGFFKRKKPVYVLANTDEKPITEY